MYAVLQQLLDPLTLLHDKATKAGIKPATLPTISQPFLRNGQWRVTCKGRALGARLQAVSTAVLFADSRVNVQVAPSSSPRWSLSALEARMSSLLVTPASQRQAPSC